MQQIVDQKREEHAQETARRKGQEELAYQQLGLLWGVGLDGGSAGGSAGYGPVDFYRAQPDILWHFSSRKTDGMNTFDATSPAC